MIVKAENGDAFSQGKLAMFYYRGEGVEQNYIKAAELFQKAFENGDQLSVVMLSFMYISGEGVTKNIDYAIDLLESCDDDFPLCKRMLGYIYSKNEIVPVDMVKAIQNYEKAALANDKIAISELGVIYYQKGDEQKATLYLTKSKELGNINAHIYLTKYAIKNANYDEAIRLLKEPVDAGIPEGMFLKGLLYLNGSGVKQDYVEAYMLISKSLPNLQEDIVYAKYVLAVMNFYGVGTQKDYNKAYSLFSELAAQGDINSKAYQGIMLQDGLGTQKNYTKALRLLTIAAQNKHSLAINALGTTYEHGLGVKKDLKKAYELYLEADNALSKNNIATMYLNGTYLEKNYAKAKELFEYSALNNVKEAQNSLGAMYINGLGVKQDIILGCSWIFISNTEKTNIELCNLILSSEDKEMTYEKISVLKKSINDIIKL